MVGAAEGFLEDISARMGAGFPFFDLAVAIEPADVGVIVAELFDGGGALREVLKPGVADVSEEHPGGREPGEGEGGFHAVGFFVAAADEDEGFVNLFVEFFEDVFEVGLETERGLFEGEREEFGDFFGGDGAGEFAGFGAAHAVADREGEVLGGDGSFADFAEVADFAGVEGDAEESVLVVFADFADVGAAPPAEGGDGWGFLGGIHFQAAAWAGKDICWGTD